MAIIAARWNAPVVQSLKSACLSTLLSHGVHPSDVLVVDNVPGAFELPFTAKSLIVRAHTDPSAFQADAVVALGCLIKGDTPTSSTSAARARWACRRWGWTRGWRW